MTPAQKAMATWVGALSRSGVVRSDAEAGVAVAAYVLGEERLSALREFFASAEPDEVMRERQAAVEVCIAMAHADREVHSEELEILRELVATSGLSPAVREELNTRVEAPATIEGIEDRLTQPGLRELMLALTWELALADGRIDQAESAFFGDLASRLGVSRERADEIQGAVSGRIP